MKNHVTFFVMDEKLYSTYYPNDACIGKEGQKVTLGEH
jgi:hypothetical protein